MKIFQNFFLGTGARYPTLLNIWRVCRRLKVLLCVIILFIFWLYLNVMLIWSRDLMVRIASSLGYSRHADQIRILTQYLSENERWDITKRFSAVYSIQGRRQSMEDRFVINENVKNTGISFFAVFDGHGGKFAADYARDFFVPVLYDKISESSSILRSIEEGSPITHGNKYECENNKNDETPQTYHGKCYINNGKINFEKMLTDEVLASDYKFLQAAKRTNNLSGSTALMAIIAGTRLIVANIGDSRGVMCDQNGFTIPLSYDHKPNLIEERNRIYNSGGFIAYSGGSWRVDGMLALSRALGNYRFKITKRVIADPDLISFDLDDRSRPKFLILASDGLWDAFTNEEAVSFIKNRLDEPHFGAKSLTLSAYNRGSTDNISVIVVVFSDGKYKMASSND